MWGAGACRARVAGACSTRAPKTAAGGQPRAPCPRRQDGASPFAPAPARSCRPRRRSQPRGWCRRRQAAASASRASEGPCSAWRGPSSRRWRFPVCSLGSVVRGWEKDPQAVWYMDSLSPSEPPCRQHGKLLCLPCLAFPCLACAAALACVRPPKQAQNIAGHALRTCLGVEPVPPGPRAVVDGGHADQASVQALPASLVAGARSAPAVGVGGSSTCPSRGAPHSRRSSHRPQASPLPGASTAASPTARARTGSRR